MEFRCYTLSFVTKRAWSSIMINHLKTEHVKMLKRHSHSNSAGLIDFYITLTYSLTIAGKVIKKSQRDQHYDYDLTKG